jgi:predicted dehydrogenase
MATSSRSRRDSASSVRLGVISFAHGHVNAYVEAIKDVPDARVVAAWDDDRARGAAQCHKYGLAFEEDLDALLRREDVDAVFVTSPTNQHAAHAVAAAQAGKHVLLQKPMALTLQDCDAIIAAVQRYGVKFSMCYQMRADPVNRKMKALLDEGAVGHVAVVRRRHAIGALLSPRFAQPGNWHIDPVQNMGMFMDDASHAADWFYWMLGRPSSVIAEIDNVVTNVAPDDNGVAVYRFANKEIGILLNSSTMLVAEATTEIYGDAGTIVQNYGDGPSSALPRPPGASALKIYRAGADDWERFDFPADTPHGVRIRAVPRPLIDYLQGRAGPLATAEDGRVCIEMILGAYRAAREGRRVHFPLQD